MHSDYDRSGQPGAAPKTLPENDTIRVNTYSELLTDNLKIEVI